MKAVRSSRRMERASSLVGLRTMKKQIRVDGEPPVTVLVERWDERWPTRWIAWGDPQPQVVTGPNAIRGFWNHGDGIFPSMGILRAGRSAQHGLGLEVRVSSPITSTKWQRLRVYTVLWLPPEPIQLRRIPRATWRRVGRYEDPAWTAPSVDRCAHGYRLVAKAVARFERRATACSLSPSTIREQSTVSSATHARVARASRSPS